MNSKNPLRNFEFSKSQDAKNFQYRSSQNHRMLRIFSTAVVDSEEERRGLAPLHRGEKDVSFPDSRKMYKLFGT